MTRILLFLFLAGLILWAGIRGARWLAQNRVRLRLLRPPTGREIFFLSMLMRFLRLLVRILLRR